MSVWGRGGAHAEPKKTHPGHAFCFCSACVAYFLEKDRDLLDKCKFYVGCLQKT